jgi:hypothetical protein
MFMTSDDSTEAWYIYLLAGSNGSSILKFLLPLTLKLPETVTSVWKVEPLLSKLAIGAERLPPSMIETSVGALTKVVPLAWVRLNPEHEFVLALNVIEVNVPYPLLQPSM